MTNKPKQIGTACETAVVRHLNANGFAGAERSALHGNVDVGDITGTPGAAWEIKGGHAAETASDAQIDAWLIETETERVNRRADVAVLVLKRKGKGAASAGQWWAFLDGWAYVELALAGWAFVEPAPSALLDHYVYTDMRASLRDLPPVRVTLTDAVNLLRRAGYGDPPERNIP